MCVRACVCVCVYIYIYMYIHIYINMFSGPRVMGSESLVERD